MLHRGKLAREGETAPALVLERRAYGGGSVGQAQACRYRLRVQFPDGTTTEISHLVAGSDPLSALSVGDLLTVRYDPADRSKIVVDKQLLRDQRDARERAATDERIARGERALAELAAKPPEPAPAPPPQPGPPAADDPSEVIRRYAERLNARKSDS